MTLIKQSLHVHVYVCYDLYHVVNHHPDCTDVWLDNMMKSLLMRRPFTSNSNQNTAQIEELPSTFSEDGQLVKMMTQHVQTTYVYVYAHTYYVNLTQ